MDNFTVLVFVLYFFSEIFATVTLSSWHPNLPATAGLPAAAGISAVNGIPAVIVFPAVFDLPAVADLLLLREVLSWLLAVAVHSVAGTFAGFPIVSGFLLLVSTPAVAGVSTGPAAANVLLSLLLMLLLAFCIMFLVLLVVPYVANVAAVLYIIESFVIPCIHVVVGCPAEAGLCDITGFPTVSASLLLLVALLLLDSLL